MAATEFQKILDHPGVVMNYVVGVLTHLQLGRAYQMICKNEVRCTHQDFFAPWRNAYPDIPVYKQRQSRVR